MTGVTVPIAPIPLARSGRRLMLAPLILLVSGGMAVAGGALHRDMAGMLLAAAGLILIVLSVALWLVLSTVRMYVEVATLRVRWLGGERSYTLARGPVTRVPLRGPDAARLRPRFGAFGWALGRGKLRGDERVEIVRLAATGTMILVPTDRGRVGVAPASEQQFLNALAAAARIQQRLDEVVERARSFPPTPRPEPRPAAAGEDATAGRVLTGIQRAILEERLAQQRAAALAAAEAERQAARDAAWVADFTGGPPAEAATPAQTRVARRAIRAPAVRVPAVRVPAVRVPQLRIEVRWDRVRGFVLPALPVLAAAGVWIAAWLQQRLGLPVEQLRPVAVALLAVGPAATLAGIAAKLWFPRLVGLVAMTSLAALVLVGRALLG